MDLDNYTYKITLAIPQRIKFTNMTNTMTGIKIDKSDFILAATGLTAKYSVGRLEIESIPPGTPKSNNTSNIKYSISITEVGTLSFIDAIHAASIQLGYENISNVPILCEVDFVGYDDNSPIGNTEHKRTWLLKIVDIQGKPTDTGLSDSNEYIISAVDVANFIDNDYWKLSSDASFDNTPTVGECLNKFVDVLNEKYTYKYPHTTKYAPTYELILHPSLTNLQFKDHRSENDKVKTNTVGKVAFAFEAGVTIGSVIDSIFDSVEDTDNSNSGGVVVNNTKRKFVSVVPYMVYIGYDTILRKNAYKMKIYVVPHKIFDDYTYDDLRNPSFNRIAQAIKDYGINKIKTYDYTFTGLNNELISMEFDYNLAYRQLYSQNLRGLTDKENKKGPHVSTAQPDETVEAEIINLYEQRKEYEKLLTEDKTDKEKEELRKKIEDKNRQIADLSGSTRPIINDPIKIVDSKLVENLDLSANDYNISIPIVQTDLGRSKGMKDKEQSAATYVRMDQRNAYNNPMFMVRVNLEVRGDPYWLSLDGNSLHAQLMAAFDEDKTINNPYKRQSIFCVNMNIPHEDKIYSNEGLFDDVTRFGLLEGRVYRATRIISRFEDGRFTQDIEGFCLLGTINRN